MARYGKSVPHDITLALEGGGALGAFTWGVLERLLEEPTLRIRTVSGSSAGAMNGAMLVQGLARGGPDLARDLLTTFWHRVAIAAGSVPGPSAGWLACSPRRYSTPSRKPAPLSPPLARSPSTPFAASSPNCCTRLCSDPRHAGTRRRRHPLRTGEARLFRDFGDPHRHAARFGLPAPGVPRWPDRRRGLLGRWLQQQPAGPSAHRSRRSARRVSSCAPRPPNASRRPMARPP